jgi:hypothetical protein
VTARELSSLDSSWIVSCNELARIHGQPAQGPKNTSCKQLKLQATTLVAACCNSKRVNLADLGQHGCSTNFPLGRLRAITMAFSIINREFGRVMIG